MYIKTGNVRYFHCNEYRSTDSINNRDIADIRQYPKRIVCLSFLGELGNLISTIAINESLIFLNKNLLFY